jgi:hypothetical protein
VQLVKCHLILQKRPAELRFVVDVAHFRYGIGSDSCK